MHLKSTYMFVRMQTGVHESNSSKPLIVIVINKYHNITDAVYSIVSKHL